VSGTDRDPGGERTSRLERVLVVNAGSSSLKLRVLDADDEVVAAADLEPPRGPEDAPAIAAALRPYGPIDAAGHRVVHGGSRFAAPVVVDGDVLAEIASLSDLAPLHQPKALAGLEAVTLALPGAIQVACFDTAYHATIPPAAHTYAIPAAWRELGVRRYGFHGLSHAYAARRAAQVMGRAGDPGLRVVTCHLGAGASLTASVGGRSVDTTMGFTPLEGLVMATRSGTIDPGIMPWLVDHEGVTAAEIADGLERRSGLAGLAGTADMREVLARAAAGDADSLLALGVYDHRLRISIGAMAAAAGGLDVLVFTGGVGERAPVVRSIAAAGLAFLGVMVDEAANAAASDGTRDAEITAPGAAVRTLVIPAREDVEIAREVRALLQGPPAAVPR
jgi:acetate kinase